MKLHQGLLLVALLAAQAARANTLTVTTTADSGPGSLRDTLASATDGDTINFSVTGTIVLTSGELLVSKNVAILGSDPSSLAVDGNLHSRVFRIALGKTVSIARLTVTNGAALGNYPDLFGGGIANSGMLTVSNCNISANWAGAGAGIHNDGGSGSATLTIINCRLTDNVAFSAGGGIFNDRAVLTVSNCTLSRNFGGGIYNSANGGSATLSVINTSLTDNSGGAIANNGFRGTASAQIVNCTLSGNSISFLGGAGIYNNAYYGTGTVQIVNSTLSGNSASHDASYGGGGILNLEDTPGVASVQILNSTLTDNSALYGANIANYRSYGSATVDIGSTILDTGASGGNIFNDFGTVTSLGYNLSSDAGGGFLTATGDQVNADPLLLPLRDNGGPTFTHALLGCSPAIDQGKNLNASPTDQRGDGFARTVDDLTVADAPGGDATDIGAFEAQSAKPVADQISDLTAYVQSLPIDSGVKNGLLVKLQDALKGANTSNKPKVCSTLQDFINLCNAQLAKKKLTVAQANALICEATRIRAAIGCK